MPKLVGGNTPVKKDAWANSPIGQMRRNFLQFHPISHLVAIITSTGGSSVAMDTNIEMRAIVLNDIDTLIQIRTANETIIAINKYGRATLVRGEVSTDMNHLYDPVNVT